MRAARLVAVVGSLAVATSLAALGGTTLESGAASRSISSYLGHSGRWITDGSGRVVILHGLNMVNKVTPFTPAAQGFGTAAASTLADDGFDVVRLGVLYQAVEPEPGVIDHTYLRAVAKTVAQLGARGVYTLLDFHQDEMNQEFGGEGFPKWSVETGGLAVKKYVFPLGYLESNALNHAYASFWSNHAGPKGKTLQQWYVQALKAVATQFSADPWVVGYDLFNEPWPAGATAAELAAFYSKAIAGIRAVDRHHLIWYEPWVTFNFGVQTGLPSLADKHVGMSFHDYCLGSSGCATSEAKTVVNALAHSASTGVALLLTEFGATDNYVDLARVVGLADANEIPWIEWSYCGCGDPTGTIPSSIEALVYKAGEAGTGKNVNEAKLKVLAEPYPTVVAGTPLSYSFASSTGTFQVLYSTRSPDGTQFGVGACSAIEVPAVQYPHGYVAAVVGGKVLSSPSAGVLEVASTAPSGTISVTVTPTSDGTTLPAGPVPASCTA